jgi:hypothetical protein
LRCEDIGVRGVACLSDGLLDDQVEALAALLDLGLELLHGGPVGLEKAKFVLVLALEAGLISPELRHETVRDRFGESLVTRVSKLGFTGFFRDPIAGDRREVTA